MNRIFILSVIFTCLMAISQAGNFIITIDGEEFEFDLGSSQTIKLEDGKEIEVGLAKKEILEFKTETISFNHSHELSPSRSKLDEGLYQTTMMTSTGSVILVQEYDDVDPSNMIDLFVQEMVKEEIAYGYEKKEEVATRTTSNGKKVVGKRVITTNKADIVERFFYTYASEDTGIFVVTQMNKKVAGENDIKMMEEFWNSFQIMLD